MCGFIRNGLAFPFLIAFTVSAFAAPPHRPWPIPPGQTLVVGLQPTDAYLFADSCNMPFTHLLHDQLEGSGLIAPLPADSVVRCMAKYDFRYPKKGFGTWLSAAESGKITDIDYMLFSRLDRDGDSLTYRLGLVDARHDSILCETAVPGIGPERPEIEAAIIRAVKALLAQARAASRAAFPPGQ